LTCRELVLFRNRPACGTFTQCLLIPRSQVRSLPGAQLEPVWRVVVVTLVVTRYSGAMRELRWKRNTWNGAIYYVSYGEHWSFQVRRGADGWLALPAPAGRGWTSFDLKLADSRFRTLSEAKLACVRHAQV
jgi:hypothetical protein